MGFLQRLIGRWSGGEDDRAIERSKEDELRVGGEERFDREDFEGKKDDALADQLYPGAADEP